MLSPSRSPPLSPNAWRFLMLKVCLDLDGVCADTGASLRAFICAELGLDVGTIALSPDYFDLTSGYPEHLRGRAAELAHDAFADNAGNVYGAAPELTCAARVARVLAHYGMVAGYVTRRPEGVRSVSKDWLKRHGFPLAPLHHVPAGTAKAAVVRELGACGMIEDSPSEALELSQGGLHVALLDWVYNRDVRGPNIRRGRNWSECASLVLGWPA